MEKQKVQKMLRIVVLVMITSQCANSLTITVNNLKKAPQNSTNKPVIEMRNASPVPTRNFVLWNYQDYPEPEVDDAQCRLHRNSFEMRYRTLLCDPDGILQPNESIKASSLCLFLPCLNFLYFFGSGFLLILFHFFLLNRFVELCFGLSPPLSFGVP